MQVNLADPLLLGQAHSVKVLAWYFWSGRGLETNKIIKWTKPQASQSGAMAFVPTD